MQWRYCLQEQKSLKNWSVQVFVRTSWSNVGEKLAIRYCMAKQGATRQHGSPPAYAPGSGTVLLLELFLQLTHMLVFCGDTLTTAHGLHTALSACVPGEHCDLCLRNAVMQ